MIGQLPRHGPRVKNAKKTKVDDITFDSQMEALRYIELKALRAAGIVTVIECHPVFELQPAFRKCCGKIRPLGTRKKDIFCPVCGKKNPATKAITYTPDFRVTYADGHQEIEDVKGHSTENFLRSQKEFEYRFPHLTLKVVKKVRR